MFQLSFRFNNEEKLGRFSLYSTLKKREFLADWLAANEEGISTNKEYRELGNHWQFC